MGTVCVGCPLHNSCLVPPFLVPAPGQRDLKGAVGGGGCCLERGGVRGHRTGPDSGNDPGGWRSRSRSPIHTKQAGGRRRGNTKQAE